MPCQLNKCKTARLVKQENILLSRLLLPVIYKQQHAAVINLLNTRPSKANTQKYLANVGKQF